MKHAFLTFTVLVQLFVLILALVSGQNSQAASPNQPVPTMEAAEAAALKQGFSEVSRRKMKDPFYSTKRADSKTWMTLDLYPHGSKVKQVALTCNQCKTRKMKEELALECFAEAQKISVAIGVDMPGESLKLFESSEGEAEKDWDLKDQAAKRVRFQRTALKCDGPVRGGGSGIRYDIFYTAK